jgi:hypothetical protein
VTSDSALDIALDAAEAALDIALDAADSALDIALDAADAALDAADAALDVDDAADPELLFEEQPVRTSAPAAPTARRTVPRVRERAKATMNSRWCCGLASDPSDRGRDCPRALHPATANVLRQLRPDHVSRTTHYAERVASDRHSAGNALFVLF